MAGAAIGALALVGTNRAADGTWTNTIGGSWATEANWSGGTIADGRGNAADFSTLTLGSACTIKLDGARTIGSLAFGDVGNAYGWTLDVGSGDPLTLDTAVGVPTIAVSNRSVVIGLTLAGTNGLVKSGAGTLTLGGTNTYTGGTVLKGGVLQVGNDNALGAGALTYGAAATLYLTSAAGSTIANDIVLASSGTQTVLAKAGAMTNRLGGGISGGGSGAVLFLNTDTGGDNATTFLLGGNNTFSGYTRLNRGRIRVASSSAFGAATNGVFIDTNQNSTNGSVEFDSTMTLANPITNSSAQVFYRAGAGVHATLAGPISGAQGLGKLGAGTITLAGANTYGGNTTVNAGTLRLTGNFNTYRTRLLSVNTGAVAESSATLYLNVSQNSWPGSTNVMGGGTLRLSASTNSAACPDLYFGADHSGNTCYGAGIEIATLDLGSSQRFIFAKTGHNSVAIYHSSNAEDARITSSIIGSGGITYIAQTNRVDMETPLILAGTNAFSGRLEIQRGSVYLLNSQALVQTNKLLLNPGSGNNARLFLYGSGATISDLESSGAGVSLIANGNVKNNFAAIPAATLTVSQAGNTTFSGVLVDTQAEYDGSTYGSGPLALAKAGAGTLTLAGINTYTGETAIDAGTLEIGSAGQLGSGSYPAAIANAGTLKVNSTAGQTLSGVLSGNGGLVKAGSGMLSLTATNTYRGGTTVSAGTLNITDGANLGGGTLTFSAAGATLSITGTNAMVPNDVVLGNVSGRFNLATPNNSATTFGGVISGGGASTVWFFQGGSGGQNTGALTLTSTNTFAGTIDVERGPLILGNAGAAGTALLYLSSNNHPDGSLQFARSFTITNRVSLNYNATENIGAGLGIDAGINSIISGSKGLNKVGAGVLTLSGANTYSGPTTVSAGALRLDYTGQNNSKLADSATLNLNGGSLELAGGTHAEAVSNAVVGGVSAITRSSGSARLALRTITRTGSGTLDVSADGLTTTDNLNSNGTLPWWITVAGRFAKNSTDAAGGDIVAYSDYVNVSRLGGQIPDGAASNVRIVEAGTGGNVSLATAGTTTVNTLLHDAGGGPALVDIGAGNILRLGTNACILLPVGSTPLVITNGTLTAGGADGSAGELVLSSSSASQIGIASAIADNGSGVLSLTKAGAGTVTLSGANTYSGSNTISAGTLIFGGGSVVGAGACLFSGGQLSGRAAGGTVVVTNESFSPSQAMQLSGGVAMLVEGEITMSGGDSLHLGYTGGSVAYAGTNYLYMTGGAIAMPQAVCIGEQESAVLTQSGGVISAGPSGVQLRCNSAAGNGVYNLSGGTLTSSAAGIDLGVLAAGTWNFTGGTATVNRVTCSVGIPAFVFGGGVLRASADFTVAAGIPITLTGAGGSATVDTQANTVTIDGALAGAGGLIKTGAGTLLLNGMLSYGGATAVSNGTLLMNGTLTNSAVAVAAGGTLGGTGTVCGAVFSSGTVAPGVSAGVLKAGSYAQDGTGVLDIEVGGTAAGTQYDRLQVGGAAALAGTLQVSAVGGFDPVPGETFSVLTAAGGVTGTFDQVLGGLGSSRVWTVQYLPNEVRLGVAIGSGGILTIR